MCCNNREFQSTLFFYLREGYPHHSYVAAESETNKYPNDLSLKLYLAISAALCEKVDMATKIFNDLKNEVDYGLAANVALSHVLKKFSEPDYEAVRQHEIKTRELRRQASNLSLYLTALVLFHFGRFEKAREYIERSLKMNLLFTEALILNGWIDICGNDEILKKKAIRFFETSADDNQFMNLDITMGKIKFFQLTRCYVQAIELLNIVTVKFPDYIPATIEKLRVYVCLKIWEQAIETAQRCLSLDENCVEAIKYQIFYAATQSGNVLEARQKLLSLERSLDRAEGNNPDQYHLSSKYFLPLCGRDPVILQNLAQMAERAVILKPREPKYAVTLGQVLLMMGLYTEATKHFQATLNHSETSVTGLQGIIQCLLAQGNLQEASNQMEFLNELQHTIGKSAELSYIAAVLGRKQSISSASVIENLDEATKLHFERLEGVTQDFSYYEMLNPAFLTQLVLEYLFQAPQQPPPKVNIAQVINVIATCPQNQTNVVLTSCLRILNTLTAATPGYRKAFYLLAKVYYILGKTTQALEILKSCLELDSTQVEGHILMAQIYLYQSNLKMAEQALETGVSNNFEVRNHPLCQLVRAKLLIQQGSAKVAINILRQAIDNMLISNVRVNEYNVENGFETQEIMGSRLTFYLELAEAHRSLGEFHEANKVLQDAHLAFAGETESARVLIASAALCLAQGDHETALTTLRSLKPEHPYYISARQHMADIYMYHRKDKKLYAACYRDLVGNVNTNETKLLLGNAYMAVQEPELAMEVFEALLRQNPNDTTLAMKMGQALLRTHHYAKAISYYEAAIKGGQAAVYLKLIDLLMNLGQCEKAKYLVTSFLTDEHKGNNSPEANQIRHAVELLANLCALERCKAKEYSELLTRIKLAQAHRLAQMQATEYNECVVEQRLSVAHICLHLAYLHEYQHCQSLGNRLPTFKDNFSVKEAITKEDESSVNSKSDVTMRHLILAIDFCKEALLQVAMISRKQGIDSHQLNLINMLRTVNETELSCNLRTSVQIEEKALAQLASLYMFATDYVACEQEALKLALLQEELQTRTSMQSRRSSAVLSYNSASLKVSISALSTLLYYNASCFMTSGDIPAASSIMAELSYIRTDFETAGKHLENVLQKNPTDYKTLSRLIDVMRRAGRLEQATTLLEKARALDPQGSSSTAYNFCRGLCYWITNESLPALQHLNRARLDEDFFEEAVYRMVEICLYPENHVTTAGNGESGAFSNNYNNSGAYTGHGSAIFDPVGSTADASTANDTADKLLKDLKFTCVKRHQFLSNMVLVTSGSKAKVETALEAFARMAKNDPESISVIYGAAVCYAALKQPQKARNQLKRLAKIQWNTQEAEELEKAWLLLADIYIQSGKTDISQDLLKRCLQHNKSCIRAYEKLAFIMEKEQKFDEAARNYEMAWTNSNRQDPAIGYKLAYNYLKSRQLVKAIEICLQVLARYPGYPKIRKDILDKARISLRT